MIGLIILFLGLVSSYKKIEENNKNESNYVNTKIKEISIFNFSQPYNAQLISSSLGADNEVLLRYLYKGSNVLVILDKKTKKKKMIINLKKELNDW